MQSFKIISKYSYGEALVRALVRHLTRTPPTRTPVRRGHVLRRRISRTGGRRNRSTKGWVVTSSPAPRTFPPEIPLSSSLRSREPSETLETSWSPTVLKSSPVKPPGTKTFPYPVGQVLFVLHSVCAHSVPTLHLQESV